MSAQMSARMSAQTWQQANEVYLAASLDWLRAALAHLGGKKAGDREALKAQRQAAAQMDPPPALEVLARRLGLDAFERDVLLLAAAMVLDTRIGGLCALAQDDARKTHPTFALALALFEAPSWNALAPQGPLRHWRLIEVQTSQGQSLTSAALGVDERILNHLKGLNQLDDRLLAFLAPQAPHVPHGRGPAVPLCPSQRPAAAAAARALMGPDAPLVQLTGTDRPTQRALAEAAAEQAGLALLRIPADLIPAATADREELVRLWDRECRLLPILPCVDASELDLGGAHEAPLRRFLENLQSHCLLEVREPMALLRPTLVVEAHKPLPMEQQALWLVGLPPGTPAGPALAQRLSGQFNISAQAIQQALLSSRAPDALDAPDAHSASPRDLPERLWRACLALSRPRLDNLAQRIQSVAQWGDLVLPEQELDMLRQIQAQCHNRGLVHGAWGFGRRLNRGHGICALFSGESGTGKTLAAEVLAGELGLDLYRIDLSSVVSKYIGETSKHLRRLFDAAEEGGAILFFDEADALFGKRSEVRDSHDRYANIETNYLLQRIEAFGGLAILATNFKQALDAAFTRRMRFIVQFPFPGLPERIQLWALAFPTETPVEALDFERLAQWNLTGASIHAIALHAAFLAAHEGNPVGMAQVLAAARSEFRKLDRPASESEFRLGVGLALDAVGALDALGAMGAQP